MDVRRDLDVSFSFDVLNHVVLLYLHRMGVLVGQSSNLNASLQISHNIMRFLRCGRVVRERDPLIEHRMLLHLVNFLQGELILADKPIAAVGSPALLEDLNFND